jgi:hypothetical protein
MTESKKAKINFADYSEEEASKLGASFWRAWSLFMESEAKREGREFVRRPRRLTADQWKDNSCTMSRDMV